MPMSLLDRMPRRAEPRLAVFDADGTLWEHDVADGCTLWLLAKGYLKTGGLWDRYQEIYAVDAPAGCRFLLELYRGVERAELQGWIAEYWAGDGRREWIEPVRDALLQLHADDYRIWVVSGTPTDIVLPVQDLLPVERVLGMDFELDAAGRITGKLAGISCAGPGKAEKIRSLWDGPVQFVAGNALLDEAMLRMARDLAWAVHPSPELRAIAQELGWPILDPPGGPQGHSEGAKPSLALS